MRTQRPNSGRNEGFTLVEVMVSSVLIVMVMGFLLTTVDQTRRTINSTTAKASQFQAARVAFDALVRNLSQATLNTYWDMDIDPNTGNPIRYRRQSDLQFVSGPVINFNTARASKAFGKSQEYYPGHGVFFQAPLGFTAELSATTSDAKEGVREYRALSNLLSVVGYYVEWGEDPDVPEFLSGSDQLVNKRFRYRLMEVIQPAESNMIFNNSNYTTIAGTRLFPESPYDDPKDWIGVAVGGAALPPQLPLTSKGKAQPSQRVLAENVMALIIVPKLAEKDRKSPDSLNDLTTNYEYDSRPDSAYRAQARVVDKSVANVSGGLSATEKKQLHQLPPILQVTMVAIDEASGIKLQDFSEEPFDWMGGLFQSCSTVQQFNRDLGDPANPVQGSLIAKMLNSDHSLPTPKLNYRIFTTDVVLRASKWSADEASTTP